MQVSSFEPEIHSDKRSYSGTRYEMTGVGQIYVVPVEQVVEVGLEFEPFGYGPF